MRISHTGSKLRGDVDMLQFIIPFLQYMRECYERRVREKINTRDLPKSQTSSPVRCAIPLRHHKQHQPNHVEADLCHNP